MSDELEAENERLRAALRYLRAAAHVFPHVNTDRVTATEVGLPDDGDVWCLGCTVGATVDEVAGDISVELMAGDDDDEWDERARRWMTEFEERSRSDDTPSEDL